MRLALAMFALGLPLLSPAQGTGVQPDARPAEHRAPIVFAFEPADPGSKAFEMSFGEGGQATLRERDGVGREPVSLSISSETLRLLEKPMATVKTGKCQTHQKHVARMGSKTLTYGTGPEAQSCTFGFSDDPQLNAAADACLAIHKTVEMGAELTRLHRFDRLGLDAAIDTLQQAVNMHYAIEVENIAPVLQSIAEDERVMERVRRKAARLLEASGADSRQSARL